MVPAPSIAAFLLEAINPDMLSHRCAENGATEGHDLAFVVLKKIPSRIKLSMRTNKTICIYVTQPI